MAGQDAFSGVDPRKLPVVSPPSVSGLNPYRDLDRTEAARFRDLTIPDSRRRRFGRQCVRRSAQEIPGAL